MAHVFWRLTVALFAFIISAYALPAMAACSYGTYSAAVTQCQAYVASNQQSQPQYTWTCQGGIPAGDGFRMGVFKNGADTGGGALYCAGTPGSNACASVPTTTSPYTGQWKVGQSFTQRYTDPVSGAIVGCKMVATNVGAPTLNPYDGKWYSRVTVSPQANPDGGAASQDGTVKNADGSSPSPAIPNAPTPAPTTNQPSPKACGGGSCYDPNTDSYIAVDGDGNQLSIPANTARGASGGCASSASATLCAGSPSPPSPQPPPTTPITDPPSMVKSVDKTMQVNPVTGVPVTVTTVTYSTPGKTTTSGKSAGDQVPAPASTAPTPPNTASGGGDCGSPPVMGGDAALAMIARQTWLLRCSEAGQVTDDSNTTVPGLDGIPNQPDPSINKEITVTDKLDFSGFGGGGQCPKLPDVDLGMFGHYDLQSDWWCDFLNKLGYVMVLLGLWRALVILGEK